MAFLLPSLLFSADDGGSSLQIWLNVLLLILHQSTSVKVTSDEGGPRVMMEQSSPGAERFRGMEREIFDAFEAPGNEEAIERLYGDDFLAINADGSVTSKAEAVEIVEAGHFPVSDTVTTDESRVRRFGDTVVVTGRSQWVTEELTVDVLHTQIWTKRDGAWQMVGWQGTPVNDESAVGPES